MRVDLAVTMVREFQRGLHAMFPDIQCSIELYEPKQPFYSWCAVWMDHLPDGLRGVYMLSDPADSRVLYIGKADRSSIGGRLWHHMRVGRPNEFGRLQFHNCQFISGPKASRIDPTIRETLFYGEVFVTALHVEPGELASLLEVFLQTACFALDGQIPPLNDRIG